MSYKCERCHRVVEQGIPQIKVVVEKRPTDTGWEIAREMKVCPECKEGDKG